MPNDIIRDAATEAAVLDLRDTSLLGTVIGTESARALIRLRSGAAKMVEVGDRVDRAQIVAIEAGRVVLARNGATRDLTLPAEDGSEEQAEAELIVTG